MVQHAAREAEVEFPAAMRQSILEVAQRVAAFEAGGRNTKQFFDNEAFEVCTSVGLDGDDLGCPHSIHQVCVPTLQRSEFNRSRIGFTISVISARCAMVNPAAVSGMSPIRRSCRPTRDRNVVIPASVNYPQQTPTAAVQTL